MPGELGVESLIVPNGQRADGQRNGRWRAQMSAEHMKERGYGKRWSVESFFSALKRTMGSALSARKESTQLEDVYRSLWILIFLAYAFLRSQAAPVTVAEISFQYREGLLWVKVNISKSEKPLNFLLDTGAGVSTINLATAKRIGLKLGQEVTVHGVETNLTGHWQEHMFAKANGVRLPSEYLSVDLETLSRSCEVPVDGLIGADFFRGKIVQIDFDAQKIRLLKMRVSDETEKWLSLELRPCGMRVPINVNGHADQWVRLDTGCATALQWVTSEVPDQCTYKMAIGLAEISIPQTTATVSISGNQFENVPTGLHESAIFPGESGLLGNGLLSHFSSITIDAKAGQVFLEKRHQSQ